MFRWRQLSCNVGVANCSSSETFAPNMEAFKSSGNWLCEATQLASASSLCCLRSAHQKLVKNDRPSPYCCTIAFSSLGCEFELGQIVINDLRAPTIRNDIPHCGSRFIAIHLVDGDPSAKSVTCGSHEKSDLVPKTLKFNNPTK